MADLWLPSRLSDLLAPTDNVSVGGFKLTSLGTPTVATDAATKAYVDAAGSGPDDPNWVFTANGLFIGAAALNPAANRVWVSRMVAAKAGTVSQLSVYVGVSSGNILCGVASIAAEVLTVSGIASQACPVGLGWRLLGSPGLAVTKGQVFYALLMASDNTATFGRSNSGAVSNSDLIGVTGLKLSAFNDPGSFILPATLALSSCTSDNKVFAMGAQIT